MRQLDESLFALGSQIVDACWEERRVPRTLARELEEAIEDAGGRKALALGTVGAALDAVVSDPVVAAESAVDLVMALRSTPIQLRIRAATGATNVEVLRLLEMDEAYIRFADWLVEIIQRIAQGIELRELRSLRFGEID